MKYGPYFSRNTGKEQAERLRALHLNEHHPETNILIGHCGSPIIQHEKYLRKLSKYRNEDVHIPLVQCYLITEERLKRISKLAFSFFGEEKCTIITQALPQIEYYEYPSKIDVAIFLYRTQSGQSNTIRLAYMGAKLYFHPRGI